MADSPDTSAAAPASGATDAPRVFRPGDVLCRSDEIGDPGSKGPFNVVLEGEETEIFLARKDGVTRAYINVCPHRYLPLNWKDDAFLTFDKGRILCVVHAAVFEIADGACVTTHCFEGLTPVEIAVENGDIRLVGTVGRPIEG
jgi:nitrite reductase/ring-hydroxylating ferredoxin subunit